MSKRKKKFRLHFSTSLFSHFKMHRVETWKVDYAGIVYYIILDKFTIYVMQKKLIFLYVAKAMQFELVFKEYLTDLFHKHISNSLFWKFE